MQKQIRNRIFNVLRCLPSEISFSRISQANIVGFSRLYPSIFPTTSGVATFGLEPPIIPGVRPVAAFGQPGDPGNTGGGGILDGGMIDAIDAVEGDTEVGLTPLDTDDNLEACSAW